MATPPMPAPSPLPRPAPGGYDEAGRAAIAARPASSGACGPAQPSVAIAWLNVFDGRITASAFAGSGW